MKATYKIHVANDVINQAALHFKMERVSPSNNWLDKAREIGYFPKLSKYLRDLEIEKTVQDVITENGDLMEQARKDTGLLRGGEAEIKKLMKQQGVKWVDAKGTKEYSPISKSRRPDFTGTPSSGESASLPPSKTKSPIQNTSKPKRPKA